MDDINEQGVPFEYDEPSDEDCYIEMDDNDYDEEYEAPVSMDSLGLSWKDFF